MGEILRWNDMIKWDEIISSDTDESSAFLQNYWDLTEVSTRCKCGDNWSDQEFALTKASIFLFGAVNWYARQKKLSIADTFAMYLSFLMDELGLPQESAESLVDNLSFLIESSDDVRPYLEAGEQSVQEFVEGNLEAPAWLADTLQTQNDFGVWSELSNSRAGSFAAMSY